MHFEIENRGGLFHAVVYAGAEVVLRLPAVATRRAAREAAEHAFRSMSIDLRRPVS